MQTVIERSPTTQQDFFLSPAELAQFHRDGVIGPFDLCEPDEMKKRWKRERLQLFDRSHAAYPDAPPASGVFNYDRHLDNDFLSEVVCRPEIAHRMSSILGPDVLCWRSEFFVKYPGDEATDWHQADTFGGANGVPHIRWPNGSKFNGTLTAWIAFTDADIETACMRFVPGTQGDLHYDESKGMDYAPQLNNKRVIEGEVRGFFGYNWRDLQIDPNWQPDESKAISMPCRAGQFLIFWSTTMHASHVHAGRTNNMRLAFAPRYVPTAVKIYENMRRTNTVEEFGGSFPLEKYGSVIVSGRNDEPEHQISAANLRGTPFVNSNPR